MSGNVSEQRTGSRSPEATSKRSERRVVATSDGVTVRRSVDREGGNWRVTLSLTSDDPSGPVQATIKDRLDASPATGVAVEDASDRVAMEADDELLRVTERVPPDGERTVRYTLSPQDTAEPRALAEGAECSVSTVPLYPPEFA